MTHGEPLTPDELAARPAAASTARRVQRVVTDRTTCEFYHTVQLPDGTPTQGQWDLRDGVDQYLGGVDFANKSVLEVGPASGYLSFYMEGKGAAVTAVRVAPQLGRIGEPASPDDHDHLRFALRARHRQLAGTTWFEWFSVVASR